MWKSLFESKGDKVRLNEAHYTKAEFKKKCKELEKQGYKLLPRNSDHHVWCKKKPCIGIFWRGGIPKTGAKYRQWDLEQLLPIFKSVDAHWVSLQYKPAGKEIAEFKEAHPEIDIVEYPHATLTNDYDDTAALVSALDHCVGMQSAITHLAGAIGVPCWTHIPINSQWRYGGDGEDYIWCKSVRLIRQQKRGEWKDVIEKTAGELRVLFGRVCKTAKNTSQKRNVRSNRKKVRSAGKSNSGQSGDRPPA
jgi:ADP-heptose:LPS heptosyltransferase